MQLTLALLGLLVGGVLRLTHHPTQAGWAWAATTVVVLVPTLFAAVKGLLHRRTGVDLVALLAMCGTLALGEHLAGAIIAVMLTGGAALERFAVSRARRNLSVLVDRAPRTAHR